jgi:hypothetical protein
VPREDTVGNVAPSPSLSPEVNFLVAPSRQARGLLVRRRPEPSDEGRRPERSEGYLATIGTTIR